MTQLPSLKTILQGLVDGPVADIEMRGLALDSRRVQPGEVFIALPGTRTQGHVYVADAVNAGAVAVLFDAAHAITETYDVPMVAVEDLSHKVGVIAERFYRQPSKTLFMVGVTGTNGKTSCSHFIAQALNEADAPCAVVGTLGNGFVGQLSEASHTTPDAISLHAMLREFADAGCEQAVMEVSSHGLHQGRVNGVCFDVAVFTNLSRDHLDYHGDMESYGQAKARLFALPGLRHAVVNGDDEFGRGLLSDIPANVETLVYSLDKAEFDHATIRGQLLKLSHDGLELAVDTPWGRGVVKSPLLGRFNASNLLAVLGCLMLAGVSFDSALQRLSDLKTVPGRCERFGNQDQPLVVVDYAHTPDALEQVLLTLREHCVGQLWCLFGCGGDRDQGKRPQMGAIAERLADRVVITDDNPRHEDPKEIIEQVRAGMKTPDSACVIHARDAAIVHAVTQADKFDVVLVAGKGHETYQQVGDKKRPFSDREQVRAVLQEAA